MRNYKLLLLSQIRQNTYFPSQNSNFVGQPLIIVMTTYLYLLFLSIIHVSEKVHCQRKKLLFPR